MTALFHPAMSQNTTFAGTCPNVFAVQDKTRKMKEEWSQLLPCPCQNAKWAVDRRCLFSVMADSPSNSERQLEDFCGAGPLAPSPPLAILSSPALQTVIPYLLKPAQIPNNRGMGARGDVGKAINDVAAIRFDALTALHGKLKVHVHMHGDEPAWQDILGKMEKRLAQGRWGAVSEGTWLRHCFIIVLIAGKLTFPCSVVGGSIATMEQ